MAATMAATAVLVPAAAMVKTIRETQRKGNAKVTYITGLNSYGGLKTQNAILSLGLPSCTEQRFADVVASVNAKSNRGGRGGALSSTCNAALEIFRIAAVMNGLVLVGVAVGFALLRIEASVEEAE